MRKNETSSEVSVGIRSGILDGVRQWLFPPEFRISRPNLLRSISQPAETSPQPEPIAQPELNGANEEGGSLSNKLVADVAVCLWYLKNKHFKKDWKDPASDADPRVRRALGRLERGIAALREYGVEVHDPTDERYPEGGEAWMKPINFQSTPGLTSAKVAETVVPVVYRDDQLIQRGEVFVEVPEDGAPAGSELRGRLESRQGESVQALVTRDSDDWKGN